MLRCEVSCLAGLFGKAAPVPAAVGFAEPLGFCRPDSDLADSCQNLCTLAKSTQRVGGGRHGEALLSAPLPPPSRSRWGRDDGTASKDGTTRWLSGQPSPCWVLDSRATGSYSWPCRVKQRRVSDWNQPRSELTTRLQPSLGQNSSSGVRNVLLLLSSQLETEL